MLSATTAESRLSTAASSATVMAEGTNGRMWSKRNTGNDILGRPDGMPPNLLPMVSTGSPKIATAAVQASIARIDPGIRLLKRGTRRITASDVTEIPTAGQ